MVGRCSAEASSRLGSRGVGKMDQPSQLTWVDPFFCWAEVREEAPRTLRPLLETEWELRILVLSLPSCWAAPLPPVFVSSSA